MPDEFHCPSCGAALPADGPEGLCPACLLKAGQESAAAMSSDGGGESRFVLPDPAELSRLFPTLEVLELIGKGGMGAVYKVRQRGLDRLVALKILPLEAGRDAAFAERFTREARALARLNHPHIVAVYDFGQSEGLYYLIMEYVDGVNLRQLAARGELTPQQALAIVPQICEALQFAHEKGVVHRDIKPENILIDTRGKARIADFGLAKLLGRPLAETTLTHIEQVMGTVHYMAPEQMETPREVDHRADIYSLGVVFYEMLTGELPLGRFAPPSSKVEVDVRLDQVVLRLLERDPQRRYQHASDVKSDVEQISHSGDSTAVKARVRRLYAQGRQGASRLWDWAARSGRSWPGMGMFQIAGGVPGKLGSERQDLRLGYVSLTVLAIGAILVLTGHRHIVESPIPWVFILVAFCLSRAAMALLSQTGPSTAQKWMLYPALVSVYLPLLLFLLVWPVLPLIAATDGLYDASRHDPAHLGWLRAYHPFVLGFCLVTTGTMLWWATIALASWWRPGWIRALFHPFARDFTGRKALWIGIAALVLGVAATAGSARVVWSAMQEGIPEQPKSVAVPVEVPTGADENRF